jgi:hypothetical protein
MRNNQWRSLPSARKVQRTVTDKAECDFYHTIQFPDGSIANGQWDLRSTVDQYLGGVDFTGKRVIEIGPASGFLSTHMESMGAQVTALEPPMEIFWDLVPRAGVDLQHMETRFSGHIERIRNSFWYVHQAFGSKVELYEADAYNLPDTLGTFDVGVLASVLLHVGSPARMISSVAGLGVKELIISEVYNEDLGDLPVCKFLPSPDNDTIDSWWAFSPAFFVQYFKVLGFTKVVVTRHNQNFAILNRSVDMFTVVGSERQF